MTASISRGLGVLIFLSSLGASAQTLPASTAPSGDCQASPECARVLEAGVTDYQQRRYDPALASFQKAHAQSNDPRVLVLMGRTYFKRGDSRGALALYERAQPQISQAADRAKLEQYIAEARAAGAGSGAGAPDLTVRPDAAGTATPAVTATPAGLSSSAPPAADNNKKLKPWMWGLIGVGAAVVVGTAIGLGVYYGTAAPAGPDATVPFP